MRKDFATNADTAPGNLPAPIVAAAKTVTAAAAEDTREHVPIESGIGGDYEMIGDKRVLVKAATVDHPEGNCARFADGTPMKFKGSKAVRKIEKEGE